MGARRAVLGIFAVNGFVLATWMSRLPTTKSSLDLTPAGLAVLLLAMSAGALVGLPLAGGLAGRIGAGATIRTAAIVMGLGMVALAWTVHPGASSIPAMAALVLVGVGNGLWDVAQNLAGSQVEQAEGRAIMPWFHAAFSLGTVAGALLGAGLVEIRVPFGAHLLVAATVMVALGLICPQWLTPGQVPAAEESATPGRSAWTEPRTLLIGLVVLAAAFTEGTANDWLAVAFGEGHQVRDSVAVLALAAFMAAMTLGRVLGTGLLDRWGRVTTLRCTFTAATLGCLMVVYGELAIAFAGVIVWGLGASLGFPVGISAAADDPRRAAMRISVVSTIGYTAFLAGPPLLGLWGNRVGVLDALVVMAVVSGLALLLTPVVAPETSAGRG